MNDFFFVKAFVLSDKLDGAIISAINQRVIRKSFNRVLKIKSVVSFQKDILRKLNFDPGSGDYF